MFFLKFQLFPIYMFHIFRICINISSKNVELAFSKMLKKHLQKVEDFI
jgi:hypothetical protein